MGRVWDCHMVTMETSTILVTAGEDCTVRLWVSPPGFLKGEKHQQSKDDGCVGQPAETYLDEPIVVLRGHKGRRVACHKYDPPLGGRALVTAGADASIKLWDLREFCLSVERESHTSHGISASGIQNNHCFKLFEGPILPLSCYDIDAETKSDVNGKLRCSSGVNATQTKHAPRNWKGHRGDSKGEYVRVYISKPSIAHVATNKGVLYRVEVLRVRKHVVLARNLPHRSMGPIALTHVKCGSSAVSDTANNLNHCAIVLCDIHVKFLSFLLTEVLTEWLIKDAGDTQLGLCKHGTCVSHDDSWTCFESLVTISITVLNICSLLKLAVSSNGGRDSRLPCMA